MFPSNTKFVHCETHCCLQRGETHFGRIPTSLLVVRRPQSRLIDDTRKVLEGRSSSGVNSDFSLGGNRYPSVPTKFELGTNIRKPNDVFVDPWSHLQTTPYWRLHFLQFVKVKPSKKFHTLLSVCLPDRHRRHSKAQRHKDFLENPDDDVKDPVCRSFHPGLLFVLLRREVV